MQGLKHASLLGYIDIMLCETTLLTILIWVFTCTTTNKAISPFIEESGEPNIMASVYVETIILITTNNIKIILY